MWICVYVGVYIYIYIVVWLIFLWYVSLGGHVDLVLDILSFRVIVSTVL